MIKKTGHYFHRAGGYSCNSRSPAVCASRKEGIEKERKKHTQTHRHTQALRSDGADLRFQISLPVKHARFCAPSWDDFSEKANFSHSKGRHAKPNRWLWGDLASRPLHRRIIARGLHLPSPWSGGCVCYQACNVVRHL